MTERIENSNVEITVWQPACMPNRLKRYFVKKEVPQSCLAQSAYFSDLGDGRHVLCLMRLNVTATEQIPMDG